MANPQPPTIQELVAELQNLHNSVQQLTAQNNTLQNQNNTLQTQLATQGQQIGQLQAPAPVQVQVTQPHELYRKPSAFKGERGPDAE